jgi:hypothetical protein
MPETVNIGLLSGSRFACTAPGNLVIAHLDQSFIFRTVEAAIRIAAKDVLGTA